MEAWPFLISASPQLDYCNVVVPDFIMTADAEREIIRASHDAFSTEKGGAINLRGYRKGIGPIDMVFRVREADERMLSNGGTASLFDNFGRKIRVVEGVVLRGDHTGTPFTEAQLDAALQHSRPHFSDFWTARSWKAVSSSSFQLPEVDGPPLQLDIKESEPFQKWKGTLAEHAHHNPLAAEATIAEQGAPELSTQAKIGKTAFTTEATTRTTVQEALHTQGKVWLFVAGAAVATGAAYAIYRHVTKEKSAAQGHAERILQERRQQSAQQPSIH